MKYSSLIDNVHAITWGLNIQEAYLFDWLYSLPSWAERITLSGPLGGAEDYYFASRTKAIEELPLLTDKPDTMYRHYKSLEEKGVIKISKIQGCDYVMITEKGKEWNRQSESRKKIRENPEIFPKKPGKKSDILYNNTLDNHDNLCESPDSQEDLFSAPRKEKRQGGSKESNNKPYTACVDVWLKEIHPGWIFGGMQGKAMKSIVKKIRATFHANNVAPTDVEIVEFFRTMCGNLPKWFKDKDLQVLDSKYNEIISQIDNQGKSTDAQAEWLRDYYGITSPR